MKCTAWYIEIYCPHSIFPFVAYILQLGSCESLFHLAGSTSATHLGHSDEGCGSSLEDYDTSGSLSAPSGIQRTAQQQVPPLVMACIEHLTMYGLNVVGIFRVSTSKRRIREVNTNAYK